GRAGRAAAPAAERRQRRRTGRGVIMAGWPARRGGAAALLVAGLLAGGCRRSPPTRVESIRVAESSLAAAAETGVDTAAIEEAARGALAQAGFAVGAGDGPAFRARVEIGALRVGPVPGGAGMQADVGLELQLTPVKGEEPERREQGQGTAPIGGAGPAPAVRGAIAAALGEAARGLRIALSADAKPVKALVADLDAADARVREHAAEVLGERRDPSAVPALVRRLQDQEPQVVHRAIGALSQIRDPRAVPALIDLSRGGDPVITIRLVHVVADIGGEDAHGWLLTLEQAHPDPRVRAAATEALRELARPQAVAGAAPRK
ncbi:MAG TPA: HEAT repeat domain-containing protein, partial [Anaeromyxobacteraceae bacterium]|nr:HEAT repeat domain-containing protein [Anaeromyxobacteraceae bacterium]